MSQGFYEDLEHLASGVSALERLWDGKSSILKLKDANYNWRQTEWWAFYFEFIFHQAFCEKFKFPGEKYGRVSFDFRRNINWDLKAKAIKSDEHRCILNDVSAIECSVKKMGEHGVVIGLCDVEYNDRERTFQRWHDNLKGEVSAYRKRRAAESAFSRYRKTKATLCEILFVRLTEDSLKTLHIMKQGRNSNDRPRPPKYVLDLEEHRCLIVHTVNLDFGG